MAYAGSYSAFFDALRERESGNDYTVVNSYGYLGAYQFGEAALIDLGYVANDGNPYNNDFSGGFTGKNGIDSQSEFLNTPSAQDAAAAEWFDLLWARIVYFDLDVYSGQTLNGVKLTTSGMIAASHLLGTGGLRDFILSGGTDVGSDAYNTQITEYLTTFANYGTPADFSTDLAVANTLFGGTGRDKLYGQGGNDSLSGASGGDLLDGGSGRDTLSGGDGNDLLVGRGGADKIFGGFGGDTLIGGSAGDALFGYGGRDSLVGNGGNDRLAGHNGNDTLIGNSGEDVLGGGRHDDILIGGYGDDTLWGGGGRDTAVLYGALEDYFFSERPDGAIEIIDQVGKYGTDILHGVEFIRVGGTLFDIDDLL